MFNYKLCKINQRIDPKLDLKLIATLVLSFINLKTYKVYHSPDGS